MPRFAIRFRSAPSRPRRWHARRREGQALVATLAVITVLGILVSLALRNGNSDSAAAVRDARSGLALQAADSAVQRYISRLVEDPLYYLHYVDPGEDDRTPSGGGATVHAGTTPAAWTGATAWTYAGPGHNWTLLTTNARWGPVEYFFQVTPPPPGSDAVTITASGRVGGDRANPLVRTVQAAVRPTSIADFQMVSNQAIAYGSTAVTTGKIYSNASVTDYGVAKGPVYAQQYVCTSGFPCWGSNPDPNVFQGGAWDSQTSPPFSAVFKSPIDFSTFTGSLNAIRDSAQTSGMRFNAPGASGWLVQFRSDGKINVWKITNASALGASMGTLGCPQVYNMPSTGAMYFDQSVVVSDDSMVTDCNGAGSSVSRDSVVNGRVTIGTAGNVYVGGNITYLNPGDDVLGLISANEVIITQYTPRVLNFRAATIAQNGQWRTNIGYNDGKHDTLNYMGSQATANGGYASMFQNRSYSYDPTLQYLRPPLYPVLEDSWVTNYWREVTPIS